MCLILDIETKSETKNADNEENILVKAESREERWPLYVL